MGSKKLRPVNTRYTESWVTFILRIGSDIYGAEEPGPPTACARPKLSKPSGRMTPNAAPANKPALNADARSTCADRTDFALGASTVIVAVQRCRCWHPACRDASRESIGLCRSGPAVCFNFTGSGGAEPQHNQSYKARATRRGVDK